MWLVAGCFRVDHHGWIHIYWIWAIGEDGGLFMLRMVSLAPQKGLVPWIDIQWSMLIHSLDSLSSRYQRCCSKNHCEMHNRNLIKGPKASGTGKSSNQAPTSWTSVLFPSNANSPARRSSQCPNNTRSLPHSASAHVQARSKNNVLASIPTTPLSS